jgi:hypothetical protein
MVSSVLFLLLKVAFSNTPSEENINTAEAGIQQLPGAGLLGFIHNQNE